MSPEDLLLLLILLTGLFVSICLYAAWIRLDLWATKRALGHVNCCSAGGSGPEPGCIGLFALPLLAATAISFVIYIR